MATAVDPVCGMTVEKAKAADRVELQGETHFFCSKQCGKKFREAPASYLQKAETKPSGHACCHGPKDVHDIGRAHTAGKGGRFLHLPNGS